MRAVIRIAAAALIVAGLGFGYANAQSAAPPLPPPQDYSAPPPPPPPAAPPQKQHGGDRFTVQELVNSGHTFFGSVSRGLAQVIEKAVSQWGLPNGYILGEDAGGAFVAGVRYGDGVL